MKIKANRKELAAALKTAAVCVQSRAMLPILNNALFEAADGKLKITCTNLEQRITATLDAVAAEPGKTTIPAKKLLSLLDALSPAEVALDCDMENFHTTLSGGASKIKLPGLNPQDFPDASEIERKNVVEMNTADLRSLIDRSQYAVSVNDARKVLQGMYFEASESRISGVGTDGKRCAVSQIDFMPPFEEGFSRILPLAAVSFLRNVKQDKITLAFDEGKRLVAETGSIVFESKLIEGNYPNWRVIVPKSFAYRVEIPTAEFLAKLNIALMIAAAESMYVDLTFRGNRLDFHVDSAANGSADDSLEIKTERVGTGDELALTLNPAMLAGAVKTCGEATFIVEFNDGVSPVNLDFGNGSFCVMMPIRKK